MERDLLFPAVPLSVLFRSLLLIQVSDREKQQPAYLQSSQDALHTKKGCVKKEKKKILVLEWAPRRLSDCAQRADRSWSVVGLKVVTSR